MRKLTAAVCILLGWSCGRAAAPLYDSATDLGAQGNARLRAAFANYRGKPGGCAAAGSGRRIIITGFGPWSDAPANPSSIMVEALGNPDFTPKILTTASAFYPNAAPGDGRIAATDYGGRVRNRGLWIDGQRVEVCLIQLDVMWDLAAAIVLHEAQRFAPELILMTGIGTADFVFETHGANATTYSYGYDSSGRPVPYTRPVSFPILAEDPQGYIVPFTWDAASAHRVAQPIIRALGFDSELRMGWATTNNYICNNLAYVVARAASGADVNLAGGTLPLRLELRSAPKTGFMHIPNSPPVTRANIDGLVRIVAASAVHSLVPRETVIAN